MQSLAQTSVLVVTSLDSNSTVTLSSQHLESMYTESEGVLRELDLVNSILLVPPPSPI